MFSYQLTRSTKRKTLSITVKNGQVFVRAPVFVSQSRIDQFLLEKSKWIGSKLRQSIEKSVQKQFRFSDGAQVLVAGKFLTIKHQKHLSQKVVVRPDEISVLVDSQSSNTIQNEQVQQYILEYFEDITTQKISQRLPKWIEITQLKPESYKIRYYKSRWGSCNSKRQLTFNSLLAMMPDDVIDYIIVHELCHLAHMNHSVGFWQLVESFIPGYEIQKLWVKKHQLELSIFH